MKLAILLLTATLALADVPGNSYVTVPSRKFPACPCNLRYVCNLDYQKASGFWYVEYLSSNGTTAGCDGTCWTLQLTQTGGKGEKVDLCCQRRGNKYCGADTGAGSFSELPGAPGELNYYTGGTTLPAFILDTDYLNWLVGFYCFFGPDGKAIQELFVYSRKPGLAPEYQAQVFTVLKKSGVNANHAFRIPQGNQCYYSEN